MSVGCSPRAGRALAGLLVVLCVGVISNSACSPSKTIRTRNLMYSGDINGCIRAQPCPLTSGDPNNPTPFKLPDMAKGLGGAFTWNFDPPFWPGNRCGLQPGLELGLFGMDDIRRTASYVPYVLTRTFFSML